MIFEMHTYPEYNKFMEENDRIGYTSQNEEVTCILDIWVCELYINKTTGKYSVLITKDSDEGWVIINFD